MRIFLTGATGYIGAAVLDALVRGGHDVTALVRNNEKARRVAKRGGHPVIGNLADPESYPRGRRRAGRLRSRRVRCASGADRRSSAPRSRRSSRRRSVRAPPGRPRRRKRFVIYTSGVWVLGPTPEPATEETPINPIEHVVVAARPRADGARRGQRPSAHRRRPAGRGLRRRQRHRRRPVQIGQQRPGARRRRRQQSLAARLRPRSRGSVCAAGRRARTPRASTTRTTKATSASTTSSSAIKPYLPVRPDVRHVPIDEARHKMGAVRRCAGARSGGPQPAGAGARVDADAAFGGGQRRAPARRVARARGTERGGTD